MKGKAKHLIHSLYGIIIPIFSVVLCMIYDNEFDPNFKFLWLNMLLPFYLIFANFLFGKNEKRVKLFDIIASILIMVLSNAACIFFVYCRYNAFYDLEYNFIDFEIRFIRYKELVFMTLFSIGILLIMAFFLRLIQNKKSSDPQKIKANGIALTTICVVTVAVILNHFGIFSLYEKIQCENLCRTMFYEIFDTRGNYENCDTSLKNNISEDLFKEIYKNITSKYNSDYKEEYEFDCVGTEFIFGKAKVFYKYDYKQTDNKNGELLYYSGTDAYYPDDLTMEKNNGEWIIIGNYTHV